MGLMFEKPPSRAQDKRQKARDKERKKQMVIASVRIRDGFRCRACGCGSSRHNSLDAHHIHFRSRGGGNTAENMALLCRSCHDDIHAYRLAVVGDNANRALRFVRRQA